MTHSQTPTLPIVILGAGYTGQCIFQLAQQQARPVWATSRFPDTHLSELPAASRILFDLSNSKTWGNVPCPAHLIWCFPALPEDTALTFAQQMRNKGCRFLLLGSTSAYPANPHGFTDETVTVNCSIPRVHSEESLRRTHGALVLRLAGIYGPDRHVFDWIRKGKIKNSDKYVNLIHVEDVAELCLAALDRAARGSSYLVSDGVPRRWSAICHMAAQRWNIAVPPPTPTKDFGKRLSPRKILAELNYELKHPDLFIALNALEARRRKDRQ